MTKKQLQKKFGFTHNKAYLEVFISHLCIIFIALFIKSINTQIKHFKSILYSNSKIILKIKGNEEQQILNNGYYICPNYILVNEDEDNKLDRDNCRKIYINPEENREINTVTLIWDSKVQNSLSMFQYLNNIIEVDLSRFDSSEVTNMSHMFQECSSITSINFSNFDTSKVTSMECTFYNCVSLKELDLSDFNTPNLVEMRLLFFDCKNIISIDISSFDTSKVLNMEFLFFECFHLKNLTLSNFDTSKVEKMNYMFFQCKDLESLDLSLFNTSSVKDMDFMFNSMSLITSLNLNNFDTSKVTKMNNLFEGCWSLKYLNISNFDTSEVTNMDYMFKNCPHLEYLDLSSFYTPKLETMKEMFNGCESLISLDISNIDISQISTTSSLFQNCYKLSSLNLSSFNTTNVNDMSNMFYQCNSLTSLDLNNFNTENVISMERMFEGCKSLISLDLSNFNLNSINNLNNMFSNCESLEYINFESYKDFDNSEVINDILLNIPENIIICINNNNTDNLNNIIEHKYCSRIYCGDDWKSKKKLIYGNIICIDNYSIIDYFNNSEYFVEKINQKIYDEIINNILKNYNGSNDDEIIIESENDYVYRVSTPENIMEGKNNESSQLSKIDLGKCEDELRENNELNENISLIIISLEKLTNISSDRNVQFEVYESLNKTRLNLSVCKNIPIDIYIPLALSDKLSNLYNELKDLGYNLFDINDKFYQDICTPYKSSNNTDILLSDRINDYYYNDETQCQSGCIFSNY